MRFVRMAWKLLVGVKDALVLIFMLLFFAALHAALTHGTAHNVGSGALVLDLNGTIVEQPKEAAPFATLTGAGPAFREYRLRDVVRALDTAATDGRVKAVVLDLDRFLGGGQVALERVGQALDKVRKSGKPVLAYGIGYTDSGYLLAAHASEIWMDPMGGVAFTGPGGSRLYYKGLMDKLGINAHVYRVGAFKSAVEPYIRTDQSPEARAANQALADAIWQGWLRDVSAARPKAQVAAFVRDPIGALNASGGDLAKAAVANGLVDRLADRTVFDIRVAQVAGADRRDLAGGYKRIRLDDWIDANPLPGGGDAIGVVTVAGTIVDGNAGPGTAAGDTIAKLVREGLAKKNLKALVVRIDSPGGSALASDRIRSAILDAKAKGLPVVVSMGSVAASGGYWVATAGDRIFAEPTTITGSIGVFGILPTFEGTLAKIGITTDGVKTTPLSGQPDLFGGTTPEFDKLAQLGVEDMYRRFLTLVSAARHLPVARVNEIAQGRVWDGGSARQLGLVDAFGGLDDAVADAARRAKLDPSNVHLVYLEKQPSWFDQIARDWGRDNEGGTEEGPSDWLSQLARARIALAWGAVADARQLATGSAIQLRCLECGGGDAPAPMPRADSLLDWALARIGL